MEFELNHRTLTRMSGNPRFVQANTPRVSFGTFSPLWETDYIYGYDDKIFGTKPVFVSVGSNAPVPARRRDHRHAGVR